ncbi:MAG TPA: hypothetical protein VLK78_08410 [Candidatus Angelobacter sp.]|nr:hypothetical protein [Candidatus Angelobacter sp.]
MNKSTSSEIKRGQAISFRVPSDTPDHLVKQLQKIKETERRNFSSKIAEFVMQGVHYSFKRERETITIPLPHKLSKSERDWLKHEHSEALLGSIIYQLLTDPVRATSLLASLNSNAVDLNEALYLQEEINGEEKPIDLTYKELPVVHTQELAAAQDNESLIDDINSFSWEDMNHTPPLDTEEEKEELENDLDDLLGDFLAKMNK